MTDAETLMRQAGMTAEEWLRRAERAVDGMEISDDAKATIIAAFIQAAAQDQHTMTIRSLAEAGLLKETSY
ncbi:Uncharacterised protein [BD1-7 clade bacterium]|uniref:Uncharacterized protein n=1 Tax=BD1-7 clade bacterium TaxID=2029982 RepID=A0A5S9Q653_9GAMM|nr:Uncharacterised protein [BD1-7 clade bacterium]